jgi:hypothetical protein
VLLKNSTYEYTYSERLKRLAIYDPFAPVVALLGVCAHVFPGSFNATCEKDLALSCFLTCAYLKAISVQDTIKSSGSAKLACYGLALRPDVAVLDRSLFTPVVNVVCLPAAVAYVDLPDLHVHSP